MNPIIRLRAKARWLSKQQNIKRKDALNLVAQEQGYADWTSCKNAIDTYWYPGMSAFLNHWFSNYKEAKEHKDNHGGYLLTYKGQYFVASGDYITSLGLDPDDPVWNAIDFDVSTSNALEKFHAYHGKRSARKIASTS